MTLDGNSNHFIFLFKAYLKLIDMHKSIQIQGFPNMVFISSQMVSID